MTARGNEIATPNPRAIPPSAVKDVEESRQQRLQRLQARFRDRGGIFVPTNRNTLVNILLGRKELSPRKSRRGRSRSRSCSPQKPPASPTSGKGKRVSLISSTAIAGGKISIAPPALRRSPRKKATASSTVDKKPEAKTRKTSRQKLETSTSFDAAPVGNKGKAREGKAREGKASAPVDEVEEVPAFKPSRRNATNIKEAPGRGRKTATKRPSKGRKAKEDEGPSTSLLATEAVETEDGEPPLPPPKTRGRKAQGFKPNLPKSSKGEASDAEDVPKSRFKSKRKLSIVQEEEEAEIEAEEQEEEVGSPPRAVLPPPSSEPSRKKHKAMPDAPATSTETRKPASKRAPAKNKRKAAVKEKALEEPSVPDVVPAKSVRKRPVVAVPDDEPPKKKVKTVVLQNMGPPDEELLTRKPGRKSKIPASAEQRAPRKRTSRQSRKKKEKTPVSDLSDAVTVSQHKSRTKPPPVIRGPRKSVMIRMQEPLPPIEDNEPDPIDFLS